MTFPSEKDNINSFKNSVTNARRMVTKACARSVFPTEMRDNLQGELLALTPKSIEPEEIDFRLAANYSDPPPPVVPDAEVVNYPLVEIKRLIKKNLQIDDLNFSNYLTTTFQSFEDGIDHLVFNGYEAKGVKGVLDDSYYKTTREKAENIGKAFSFAKAGFSKEAKRSEFRNLLFSAAGESFGTSNSARSALISYATNAEIDKFNSKGVIGFVDNLFNEAGITTIHRTNRVGNNILIYENNIAKIKVLFGGKDVQPMYDPENMQGYIVQYYHLITYGFVPFSKRELVKIVIT